MGKFEILGCKLTLERNFLAFGRAKPLAEPQSIEATLNTISAATPLVDSARLERYDIPCFDSGCSIFGKTSVDKTNVKIPLRTAQVDTRNSNGEHELGGIGLQLGEGGVGEVAGRSTREDDAVGEGADGQTEEDRNEENDQHDGDDPPHQSSIGLLLLVALEGGVGEEVTF